MNNNSYSNIFLKSIFWRQIAEVMHHGVGLIVMILIARILSPEVVGRVAIAIAFSSIATLIAKFGLGSAILVFQERKRTAIDSCFTLALFFGIFIVLTLTFTSSRIADFYGNNDLIIFIPILALSCLFNAVESIPIALIERDLKFSALSTLRAIKSLVLLLSTAIMLFLGFQDSAIIFPIFISSILSMMLAFIIANYLPKIYLNIEDMKRYYLFIKASFLQQVTSFTTNNLATFAMGSFWSSASMGYYNLAQRANDAGTALLANSVSNSFLPIFSKITDKSINEIRLIVCSSCHYQRILLVPLFIIALMNINEIVVAVFGAKWIESSRILFYFLIVRVITFCLPQNSAIFYAIKMPEIVTRLIFFRLVGYSASVLYCISYSLEPLEFVFYVMLVDSLFNVIGTIISTKKINIPFKNFILDNVSSFIFLFLFTLLLICINTFLLMYVKINIVLLIFLQLLIQLFLIKILLPYEYIVLKDKIAQFLNS